MKGKKVILSLAAASMMVSANADSIQTMFTEGKVSGQVRAFSISRAVKYTDSSKDYTRDANAIGGYVKYETGAFNGISLGVALYTTNGFLNDSDKTDYTKVDPTLLGKDNSNDTYIGQAYLQYQFGKTTLKGGRQKLDTPLAGSDDARMLPNLFEAYVAINQDVQNTTLIAAHVTKFAQGTFGRAYNGGILAATGGYSAADSRNRSGEFVNMGEYALGSAGNNNGVSAIAAIYAKDNLKVQFWDYYAYDILNAIYIDGSYKIGPASIAAQYIGESDIGDKYAGTVDSNYFGVKAGIGFGGLSAYVAYSTTSANSETDAATKSAIISPWGGMPAFTQGMVTRHQFLAGTDASKLAATYNFKDTGVNLKTTFYYTSYAMDINNGYTKGDASEMGFDFIYYPSIVKNLQLRLRGNFTDDFYADGNGNSVEWDEYRLIVNYNF